MGYHSQESLTTPCKYADMIQGWLDPPMSPRLSEAAWLYQEIFPLEEGESVDWGRKAWYQCPV